MSFENKSYYNSSRRSNQRAGKPYHSVRHASKDFLVGPALYHPSKVVKGIKTLTEATREDNEKYTRMKLRIYELEHAISELQKKVSNKQHPLLKDGVRDESPGLDLDLNYGSGGYTNGANHRLYPPDDETGPLVERFGMMSVKDNPFHGGTATVEHLVKVNRFCVKYPCFETHLAHEIARPKVDLCAAKGHDMKSAGSIHIPLTLSPSPTILLYSVFFPLPPCEQSLPEMTELLQHLPSYDIAVTLMDSYLHFFGWAAMPVPKKDLKCIFERFYPKGSPATVLLHSDFHQLAVLFMVFALGTLYDIGEDKSHVVEKTKIYNCLTRTALMADPVTENPTLPGVQAIMLMLWYLRLLPGIESLNFQWPLLGILNKVLQSIALHRDKSIFTRWPEEQRQYIPSEEDRRPHEQTFWEFFSVDVLQSCMVGRPMTLSITQADCRIPSTVDAPDGLASSFYIWKYSFSCLVSHVMARISGTTEGMEVGKTRIVPVQYEDILLFENKLKSHYVPKDLAWPAPDEPLPRDEPVGKVFQRFIAYVWNRVLLMYIHREYFNRSLRRFQLDPTKSPMWHSVEVVYSSAIGLVNDIWRLWLNHPRVVDRMCSFWSHLQSAATMLGSLVSLSPGCRLSRNALHHLDKACDLFARARNSFQPPDASSSLEAIQRDAHRYFKRFHDTANQFEHVDTPETSTSALSPMIQSPYEFQALPAISDSKRHKLEDDDE